MSRCLQDFNYLEINVNDDRTEDLFSHFDETYAFISNALNEQGRVLVHWHVIRPLLHFVDGRVQCSRAFS